MDVKGNTIPYEEFANPAVALRKFHYRLYYISLYLTAVAHGRYFKLSWQMDKAQKPSIRRAVRINGIPRGMALC